MFRYLLLYVTRIGRTILLSLGTHLETKIQTRTPMDWTGSEKKTFNFGNQIESLWITNLSGQIMPDHYTFLNEKDLNMVRS